MGTVAENLCFSLSTQAYLREGVALYELGRHGEALVAFAHGLTEEPASIQLLEGLLEAALKSQLKGWLCYNLTAVSLFYENFRLAVSITCQKCVM